MRTIISRATPPTTTSPVRESTRPSKPAPTTAVRKPPAKPQRSTTMVVAPPRAALRAAPIPAQPAPQTSTSGSASSGTWRV
jgi:hypothetical protein